MPSARHAILAAAALAATVALTSEWRWLRFEAARGRTQTVFSGATYLRSDGEEFRNEDGGRRIPLVLAAPGAAVAGTPRLVLGFEAQPGYRVAVAIRQFEGPKTDPAVLRVALEGEGWAEIRTAPGGGLDPYGIEHGTRAGYDAVLPSKSECGASTLTLEIVDGSWIALEAVEVSLAAPRFLAALPRTAGGLALALLVAGLVVGRRPRPGPTISGPTISGPTLALGLAGLIAGLGIAEGVLRLAAPRLDGARRLLYRSSDAVAVSGQGVLEDLRRHRCAPAPCSLDECGFRLNRDGLHTPDYPREKAAGKRRIVGIGDSFMNYGGPVPHREEWLVRLGARLAMQGEIETINLGFSCIGLPTELRVLQGEGLRLAPDLVIWSVYVGNDLEDEGDERARARGAAAPARPWMDRFLLSRLALGVKRLAAADAAALVPPCAATSVSEPRGCGRLEAEAVPYDPTKKTMADGWYESYARGRLWQLYRRDRRGVIEQDVADALRTLEEGRRALGATPLLVVLLPDELHVSHAERARALAFAPELPSEDLDFEWPTSALRAALTTAGFDLVDLTPDFRAALDRGDNPYQPNDGHLSVVGNRLVAERVGPAALEAVGGRGPS